MPTGSLSRAVAVFSVVLLVLSVVPAGGAAMATASNLHGGQISPGTVDDDTTVRHEVSYRVDDLSADGDTDVFYVRFPDGVALAPENVQVVNRETGETVAVSSSPTVVDGTDGDGVRDTIRFAVSPDGQGSVDVAVNLTTLVRWPDVQGDSDALVLGSVIDSSGSNVPPSRIGSVLVRDTGGSSTTTTTGTTTTQRTSATTQTTTTQRTSATTQTTTAQTTTAAGTTTEATTAVPTTDAGDDGGGGTLPDQEGIEGTPGLGLEVGGLAVLLVTLALHRRQR
ncbi:hypothetical protein [Haloarchaeobius sp. HME9146]|uniref:hypothetical protein n=1 Tax=Haloarchaeobius sp. HME9146 TaxID=2978732 RepID=UPI0021BF19DF|nr:hypothetical protein [Haloarchaeobius sp. HME9146]MCT9096660.1 hypothetical protein [Haloarchaeobius sp. HME9146]